MYFLQHKPITVEISKIYNDCLFDDEYQDNTGFIFLSSYIEAPFSWADAVALGNKVRFFCEKIVAGEIL